MENIVDVETSIEEEINLLLGMIDDNFKLYPEYSDDEFYSQYFKENSKEFCNSINELIVKHMNCETYINYYHIIGVFMYIKHNYSELSFDDVINMMFDKTNTKAKIRIYTSKKIS